MCGKDGWERVKGRRKRSKGGRAWKRDEMDNRSENKRETMKEERKKQKKGADE